MNKANNMQTKKVFSAAKHLAVMAKICKICDKEEMQYIIIPAINPKAGCGNVTEKHRKNAKILDIQYLRIGVSKSRRMKI